jgi:hypothetical protein
VLEFDSLTVTASEWSVFQSSTFTDSRVASVPKDQPFPVVLLVPTGIQVTFCMEHPVAVIGLNRIQGWLKRKTPLLPYKLDYMSDRTSKYEEG